MIEQIIEVTTRIKVNGLADQHLLNHLKQMAEADFREMYSLGEATPNNTSCVPKYEETELELIEVNTSLKPINHLETACNR